LGLRDPTYKGRKYRKWKGWEKNGKGGRKRGREGREESGRLFGDGTPACMQTAAALSVWFLNSEAVELALLVSWTCVV